MSPGVASKDSLGQGGAGGIGGGMLGCIGSGVVAAGMVVAEGRL